MLTVQQQHRAAQNLGISVASPAVTHHTLIDRFCETMPRLGVDLATVPTWPALESAYGLSTEAYNPAPEDESFRQAVATATLGMVQRLPASNEHPPIDHAAVTAHCLKGFVSGSFIAHFPEGATHEIVRNTLTEAMRALELGGSRVDYAEVDYLQQVLDAGEFGNARTSFHALKRRFNNWRGVVGSI